MQKTLRVLIVAAVVLLCAADLCLASSVVPVDLKQMSHKAGRIFYGRCTSVEVIEDQQGITSTQITYEVIRSVKGDSPSTVTFKVFGLAAGNGGGGQSTLVGLPHFYPGREDVLFLYKESSWGFTSPVGLWQGAFPVMKTGQGPRLVNTNRSYRSTLGSGFKAATSGGKGPVTPDDLLDEVENILR